MPKTELVENFLVVKNLTPEMSQNVTPKWRYFKEKWLVKKVQLNFSTKKRTLQINRHFIDHWWQFIDH